MAAAQYMILCLIALVARTELDNVFLLYQHALVLRPACHKRDCVTMNRPSGRYGTSLNSRDVLTWKRADADLAGSHKLRRRPPTLKTS